MTLKMASMTVIFGVNSTGTHILVVIMLVARRDCAREPGSLCYCV